MNENTPTTDNHEPDIYQPVALNPNALRQVEGSEITPGTPTTVALLAAAIQGPNTTPGLVEQPDNPVVPPAVQTPLGPKKPHNGLKITLIVIVSLLVLLAVGFSVFYFSIRTPNSEYDAAIENLQTMKTSGESIRDMKVLNTTGTDYLNSQQYNEARKYAATYVGTLARLQAGPVMKTDTSVASVFAKNKALIELYGQSTIDMGDTIVTYEKVTAICSHDLNKGISTQTTRQMLDETFVDCKKALGDNPTVPTKPFNDGYYVKYVAAVKAIINAAYTYADALDSGNANAELRATTSIKQAISEYFTVESKAGDIKITNTAQPSAKIADVIKAVQQRKDILFRW